MFKRRLSFESLETRELLSAQPFYSLEFPDLVAESYCSSTDSLEVCGITSSQDQTIQHLWNTIIRPYLKDDLWQTDHQYDAGHNLMVPLHAAFQLDNREWQLQFADQFSRFTEAEASLDIQSEISLGRIQFLYLGSRFVNLAHQAGKPEVVPSSLVSNLYESLERVWLHEPAWQWGRDAFAGGVKERIAWKLETTDVSATFHRAIIDFEEFVFAIAADLRSYERSTREPHTFSPVVTDILDSALSVHQQEIVLTPNGGWLMQPGVWSDHPTYSHAGHTQLADNLTESKVDGIAEDSAHAVRRPLWLRSLAEAYEIGSAEAQYYESLIVGLETQFYETLLVQPTEEFPTYRLNNYMDGYNGVYRWNFATHPNDGYAPFELSGVLHDGWWGFLNTERIQQTFSEIVADMPFIEQQTRTFEGPGTSRSRHPTMLGAYSYENRFLELTSRLASELSGWKPVINNLPAETKFTVDEVAELALVIDDHDGDSLTTSARTESMESLLHWQLGLKFTGNLHENWGGIGEKWVRGSGSNWYFIKPNGELWEWDGSNQAAGWFVAQLSADIHVNPELLYAPQPNQAQADVATIDQQLIVTPQPGFTGSVPVIITASDGHHSSSNVVIVQFNDIPQLVPIANQVVPTGDSDLIIELDTVNGRSENTQFSARAVSTEYLLDSQLGLTHDGDFEENWGGQSEKWIEGRFNTHYYLTPDGELYRWDWSTTTNGQFIANLGSAVYDNPALLFDAVDSTPPVNVVLTDHTLVVEHPEDFAGTYAVEVSVQESADVDQKFFTVTVENQIELERENIFDLFTMPSSQDRAFLRLPDQYRSNNSTIFSANAFSQEFALDQEFGFNTNGNLYENWGGIQEKWIISADQQWYFITPEGSIYRWDGSSSATGELITTLNPEVHTSPELIYAAEQNSAAAIIRVWGDLLEIDPQVGFSGTFSIEVTAERPGGNDPHWIQVDVNQTPDLTPLTDQNISAGSDNVTIDLHINDADDQQHDINVQVQTYEAFLDDALGLSSSGNYYLNWGGTNEKWLIAADKTWYFIRPDGALYLWDPQDFAASLQIAQLSSTIYESPHLLHAADHNTLYQPHVVGNQIVIDPRHLTTGAYVISIEASDGISSDMEYFKLTVA